MSETIVAATVRQSRPEDRETILGLIESNSREALTEQDRDAYGFVQGDFTASSLAALEADTGVVVVEVSGKVVGFAGTSQNLAAGNGPLAELLGQLDQLTLHGRPVSELRPAVYGPVVVDRAYRGKGLLRSLFEGVLGVLAGKADVGVLFVEDSNRHSMAVHVNGLGMECIGGFELDGRGYSILAFPVPRG
ncbi:GNAT family N-acetyltransferase [Solihabitans fulvus]|uniref:GNAT family N-acetyltransferase n=1 Tax=Solihabitans fulvus TaxID=1892852 RepID=UPI0016620613|nr:GNAT family N-acetyltransferase [Solihabitans fulvus]